MDTFSIAAFRLGFYLNRQRLEGLAVELEYWISFKRGHNANFRAVVIADRQIRRIITVAYSIVIAFLLRERERVRRERVTRDPRRH